MHPRSIRLATGLVAFIFVGASAHAQTPPPVNPGRIDCCRSLETDQNRSTKIDQG
jgi:hypothetical protein